MTLRGRATFQSQHVNQPRHAPTFRVTYDCLPWCLYPSDYTASSKQGTCDITSTSKSISFQPSPSLLITSRPVMAGSEPPSGTPVLSPERQEAVATFRALADLPDDETAAAHLAASNWDLQAAVDIFLSGGSTPAQPPPAGAVTPTPAAQPLAVPARSRSRRPPQPPPAWLGPLLAPLRAAWRALHRFAEIFMRLFGGHARAIEAAPGSTHTRRFLAYFDARYCLEGAARPAFFDGRYLDALAAAQREVKFLLVYLHSEAHPVTASFVRRVLLDPTFVETVSADFVVWAGSITQPDAAAVQHALRVDSFPFLGIVSAPRGTVRTGQTSLPPISSQNYGLLLSHTSGNHLCRHPETRLTPREIADGVATPPDSAAAAAITWVELVQRDHNRRLDAIRRERESRDMSRMLRQEQDAEFAASLEADRARERERARAKEEEEKEAALEQARLAAETEKAAARETRQARKREGLPAEPEKAAGVATVVLRLPEGGRASRRFNKSDVLEVVFDWAEGCCGVDVDVACLVASYPRKVFQYPEDASLTLEAAGFFPSAMLLLEERSGES